MMMSELVPYESFREYCKLLDELRGDYDKLLRDDYGDHELRIVNGPTARQKRRYVHRGFELWQKLTKGTNSVWCEFMAWCVAERAEEGVFNMCEMFQVMEPMNIFVAEERRIASFHRFMVSSPSPLNELMDNNFVYVFCDNTGILKPVREWEKHRLAIAHVCFRTGLTRDIGEIILLHLELSNWKPKVTPMVMWNCQRYFHVGEYD
jgi:hypothetical protein